MKQPMIISMGLLLFLFGLAIAKAGNSEQKIDRNPAQSASSHNPSIQ